MTDNSQALTAFVARKVEIDAALARLTQLSDDHFDVSPDDVHWGHAGSLTEYRDLLGRITDMAFGEGEYAKAEATRRDREIELRRKP